MKAKLLLLIALCLSGVATAQDVDKQKVDKFATAVAHAEGFGVRHAIPTRNHNPGDIKRNGRYVHFKNDSEGWSALRAQITRLASGDSKKYHLKMTINQVSKTYAGDYRWGKIVAKIIGVSPTTTLAEYFAPEDVEPPALILPERTILLVDFTQAFPIEPVLAADNDLVFSN